MVSASDSRSEGCAFESHRVQNVNDDFFCLSQYSSNKNPLAKFFGLLVHAKFTKDDLMVHLDVVGVPTALFVDFHCSH